MGAVGDDEELICRKCSNAVCVTRDEGAHWRMKRDAVWSGRLDPVHEPEVAVFQAVSEGLSRF